MANQLRVARSDLEKVNDAVVAAYQHHLHRDQSNARLHLASTTRQSPLTSELGAAVDRLDVILHGEEEG